jgi:predicted deacylase
MKPATVSFLKSSGLSESSGNFLVLKLTGLAVVNQVKSQIYAQSDRSRNAGSLTLCGALCLIATQLAGCDPSPASQALKARDRAVTESPGPTQDETKPLPATSGPPAEPIVTDGKDLVLLGQTVPPGTSQRLMWSASEIFEGVSTGTPVLIVNGHRNGPTLCLTAAIHGDELNGIEMVRRVLHDIDPGELNGAIIGIPIVNLQGFRRGSRYLPDRRDLNRYFPGNPLGSSAARIAYSLFEEIIRHCDALVDLHTGSFYRTNLPQLRADLRYSQIKELTHGFGGIAVLHSIAAPGTLRRAATDAGIPTVTLEAGEPLRLQTAKVSQGVNGVFTLLNTLDMVHRDTLPNQAELVFYESTWVRADHGGILFTVVRLGQKVAVGDVLGTVTDPITNEQNLVYSPENGRILGMALNQVVMPGFAAFRIGIETDGPPTDPAILSLHQNENFELPSPTAAKKEFETMGNAAIGDPEESSEE